MGSQYTHDAVHLLPMHELPRTFVEWQARSGMPMPTTKHPQPHLGSYVLEQFNGTVRPRVHLRKDFEGKKNNPKNPAGQPTAPGRAEYFGYRKDKVIEVMREQLQTERDKNQNAQAKAKTKKPAEAPPTPQDEDQGVADLWSYGGKLQFDIKCPLPDYDFSWWYVMVYELEPNVAFARAIQDNLKVKVKVICIVCWLQQWVGTYTGVSEAWIHTVDIEVNFPPQIEDQIQLLQANNNP